MSIYQIVVKGDLNDDSQLRNVHHYDFPSYVPNTTEIQEAVDAIDGYYKTRLQAIFSDNVDFEAYDVRRVDLANLPAVQFVATAGSWSGSSAIDQMPAQVSALVTFKAQTVFPRTSRAYLFPFTENVSTNDGRILSSTLTSMLNWGLDMLTLPITGQTDAVKVAVKYTGTPPVVTSSNAISTVSTHNNWATQRRRRPGVGI